MILGIGGVIVDSRVHTFDVLPGFIDVARQRISFYRRAFGAPQRLTPLFPLDVIPPLDDLTIDEQNMVMLLARSLVAHARDADRTRGMITAAGLHDLTGWAYFVVKATVLPDRTELMRLTRLPETIADATRARHWLYQHI